MPSTVKPLSPDMRQRLAATLSGDSKPGSLRHHLIEGLLGSQTGDDSGLVGYTPLGMVFAADAANRDRRMGGSGIGHTLEAAAGMIPGAGKLEGKALKRVLESEAFVDALDAAHEMAGKKAKAEFHNFGWGGTDTGLASKTDQGILETEFNPKTGKFEHSLDGSFLHTSDLPPSLIKGAVAEEAYDASRLPKMERAVGSKARNRALDDELAGIEEGAYDKKGPPDIEHDPATNPSPMSANNMSGKTSVRQQLEQAANVEPPKPKGHDFVIGGKKHAKAASDYLDKLGEGGEQQFMHDNDLKSAQETIDHLMENYDPEELIAMTDRMDPLTSREYRQGGTDMNREDDIAQHINDIKMQADVKNGSRAVVKGDPLRDPALNTEQASDLARFEAAKAKRDGSSVRQQLEAAGGKVVDDDMMRASKEVGAIKKNAELDYNEAGDLVPRGFKNGPHYGESGPSIENQIAHLSGQDTAKSNFIRNAMDDEGGNVPEEVADVLVQSLMKNPQKYKEVAKRFGPEAMEYPEKLHDELYNNLSIPEMLAMHYDLDPKTLGKAYTMPAARPKGRPTQ